jgi:sRNA-binding carbon storage regulator CsrA
MLIISRKTGSSCTISVPGWPPILIENMGTHGGTVRLGITAPREIVVLRDDAVRSMPRSEVVPPSHNLPQP